MSNTKIGQTIFGYKLQSELTSGESFKNLVLSSPDGSLYYQHEVKDLINYGVRYNINIYQSISKASEN